ncbi:MAG: secretin N-terminal domain-containing protein [Candidatus Omnitrophota bacterium]
MRNSHICISRVFKLIVSVVFLLDFSCIEHTIAAESELTQLAQAAVNAPMEQTDIAPIISGMGGKISLDLRNIDVMDALKFLAMKTRMNIVATKNVTGRVTLSVDNVMVRDIFDIMLRSNELAYVEQGNIYNVMTEDEYRTLFGRSFSDMRKVRTFKLQYVIPEQGFSLLDTLKSTIGRVLVEPDSGTVLIMDTPEKIEEIEKALEEFETRNEVKVFDLQYALAKDVEEQLKPQLNAKKVGTIKADERTNQIIVQALPGRMKEIEELVIALDQKTQQVIIDAKIIKIKFTDATKKGLEWEGILKRGERIGSAYLGSYPFSAIQAATDVFRTRSQVLDDLGGEIGSIPFSGYSTNYGGTTKTTFGEDMHLGLIHPEADVDLLINYLNTIGKTQILSSPRISAINNQEAKIHVGERQAYVTTTTTSGQTTTTVSEEVTFIDVGIQLSVTPVINEEGYVRMKIKPEISAVVDTLVTPSGNRIPIIDTSTAETTVLVKDGTTIIIGGLQKEESTDNKKQFPILGNIPILGFFFGTDTKTTIRTELMIMLTPTIVIGDKLTTGDERDFKYEPARGYDEYENFSEDKDMIKPTQEPEERIKPYMPYEMEKGAS